MRFILICLFLGMCLSCGSDPLPKPKAFLRLEYPAPKYEQIVPELPFVFERNSISDPIRHIKASRDTATIGFEINYPDLRGTVYLTYKRIAKDGNVQSFIADAQNITQTHALRADGISEQPYADREDRVFGSIFEVVGNAASQSQFYVTDSTRHFLTGSLYFYTKPNYDSILPAADYLTRDIRHLMESLKWKP